MVLSASSPPTVIQHSFSILEVGLLCDFSRDFRMLLQDAAFPFFQYSKSSTMMPPSSSAALAAQCPIA